MKFVIILALFISLVFGSDDHAISDMDGGGYRFSTQEVYAFSSMGFFISSGKMNVNAIGGWADGEYDLDEVTLTPTDHPNTFIADLVFVKKKGMMRYTNSAKVGIAYDGYRLWIKYQNSIYRYTTPDRIHPYHVKNKKVQSNILDTSFDNINLRFEF